MKILTEKDLQKLTHKQQVCFAIFCAEQVTHLLCDKTREPALKAIETAKLWLEGRASSEDCARAGDAADTIYPTIYNVATPAVAVTCVVYDTDHSAHNAAHAANATLKAANTNEKEKVVEAQWAFYRELLEFDEIFEREVL